MALAVGEFAPDFTLLTMGKKGLEEVRLFDHIGRDPVLLLFVPGAFTGTCTAQLCDDSGGLEEFEGAGAVVYGVSVDSAFVQAAWAKHAGIKIPLLSDFRHEVVEAYGVVLEDFAGMGPSSLRAAFVIDLEGVIRYSEVTATLREVPDRAGILECLTGIRKSRFD
ncbi:MAG: redoxin domain-containing protein [Fimbriimonadaceae bacterium]